MEVKMKKMLLGVFACLMLLSITVSPVSAKRTRTSFTGISYYIEELDPGEQWLEEDRYYIRGLKETYLMETSDPRLCGYSTLISDVNFTLAEAPVYGYGPIWSTSYLENDGGYWTGVAYGVRTKQGFNYHFEILHGHGGYEGLTAKIYDKREITDPIGPMEMYGVIIESSWDWPFGQFE
jgi:hypothetical protein